MAMRLHALGRLGEGKGGARCWGREAGLQPPRPGREPRAVAFGSRGGRGGGRQWTSIVLLNLPEFSEGGRRGEGVLVSPYMSSEGQVEVEQRSATSLESLGQQLPASLYHNLSLTHTDTHSNSHSLTLFFFFLHFVLVCARAPGCW